MELRFVCCFSFLHISILKINAQLAVIKPQYVYTVFDWLIEWMNQFLKWEKGKYLILIGIFYFKLLCQRVQLFYLLLLEFLIIIKKNFKKK